MFKKTHWLSTLVLTAFLALSGCGGSSESTSPETPSTPGSEILKGELLLSLTDAEGDFLTYNVDVKSITLTHRNGSVIEALPQTTTVDFAQYVDATELLSVGSAPYGAYQSASITLDFSDAMITVQDETGHAVAATAVDEAGIALTETTVVINFNGENHFVISPGRLSHITLDFDLDASNSIELGENQAIVTVKPVMLADTLHSDAKPFRLRGLLSAVDTENQRLNMELRPFRIRHGIYGGADVAVDEATNYEINGQIFTSSEGLNALSALQDGESIVVLGRWNTSNQGFTAEDIKAGTSVAWDDADLLRGTVTAREGDVVTLKGAIAELANGTYLYNDTLTLNLAESTTVTKRGALVDLADISVGSYLQAAGTVISDNEMDASHGYVRVAHSNVAGTVATVDGGFAMDVVMINGRRIELFDFSGTGQTPEQDADPAFYEIDTQGLGLSNIAVDDPVRVRGYANDFGSAPADFTALSVAGAADVRSHMLITYGAPGSLTALSAGEDGLLFNLDDAASRHHIVSAGIPIDLTELETVPTVVPSAALGIYTIAIDSRIEVFLEYDNFAMALNQQLEAGHNVLRFDAHGYYQRANGEFESQRLRVWLHGD